MPTCCRCNGKGRCKACICKKNGSCCTNCLPGRNGRCENTSALSIQTSQDPTEPPDAILAANVYTPPSLENLSATTEAGGDNVTLVETQVETNDSFSNFLTLLDEAVPDDMPPQQCSPLLPGLEIPTIVADPAEVSDELNATTSYELPPFSEMSASHFMWGNRDGVSFTDAVDKAYNEAVHWKRNLFMVPSGKAGKQFVKELARLFQAFADQTPLERIALKAAMLMPMLLLQKPHATSKAKEHLQCLDRRLNHWFAGEIEILLKEAKVIQRHIPRDQSSSKPPRQAEDFADLMQRGKTRAALRLLSDKNSTGVLSLDDMINGQTVREVLKDKHPPPHPLCSNTLQSPLDPTIETHPVLFGKIDGELIRSTALKTQGAAGPSGVDAWGWRRLCTSFQGSSRDLCNAIASATRRNCTSYVDPSGLEAITACRLIPLTKNPGVRPIGICETIRRIMSKAALLVTKPDIQIAVGPLQTCAGYEAGCEAAIHFAQEFFSEDSVEGLLLVDASNAFNNLNRRATLLNCQTLCPSLAPILTNMYRSNANLFVGGETILSQEGTTQGDPLAMAICLPSE